MSQQLEGLASAFYVWRNGNQGPYVTGVWRTIQWNTQVYDLLEEVDIAAPYRFTPRKAGYYLLIASVSWSLGATDISMVRILQNGVLALSEGRGYEGAAVSQRPKALIIAYLTPNDYITVETDFTNVPPPVAHSISGVRERTYFCGKRLL